ncbi:MAG: alpha/beta hydrolase [Rhodoblastus sp.]
MPSIRAHIVSFLTRHITKKQLSACKTPEDVRRVFNAARTFPVKGVTYTPATLGGVAGEWAQADGVAPRATLLYLHGGGYVGMSPVTHRPITGAFAKRGFRVFAPDYRLAPEHPFPAALDDATAAWRALRSSVEGPCCVAGDSAGGGLTLALLLNLKGLGERMADAACMFSPWTDLAATGESMRTNAQRDPLLVSEGIEKIAEAYAGAAGTRDPLVSPLYGDYSGLPPLIFYVGESEILRDDSLRAVEKARAAGVVTQAHVFDGVPHVWQFMSRILPEGRRSMDEAAAFLMAPRAA